MSELCGIARFKIVTAGACRRSSRRGSSARRWKRQRTLGEETYRRAHAEGYAMDIDAAVAYVLEDAQ